MVNRLPVWLFLSVALILIGSALLPGLRVLFGIDHTIGLQFLTVVALLIGGLMSGLTAMILMVRRQTKINWPDHGHTQENSAIYSARLRMHACGLLLFCGIPLLNFLACYWLWIKHRRSSQALDETGQEVLNFQITMYLYLMLSLIMVIAVIGIISTPLLLAFNLLVTLWALVSVLKGNNFTYPVNIPIIQGRQPKE